MSRTISSSTYNVVIDAHRQAKARADKGRLFALYLRVHHRDFIPEDGVACTSKRARKKRPAAEATQAAAGETAVAAGGAAVEVSAAVAASKGSAPCWLPREIIQIIIRLASSLTVEEVLRERQRGLHVINVKDWGYLGNQRSVLTGFPDIGPADNGFDWVRPEEYQSAEGVMALNVRQLLCQCPVFGRSFLTWRVCVDMKRVPVDEAAGDIEIPESAISLTTNAADREGVGYGFVPRERVEVMQRFRLRGVLRKDTDLDFSEAGKDTNDPSRLRFSAGVQAHYLRGMQIDRHAGVAVGDRVRIIKTYKAFEHFALGLEGVVRAISLQTFVLYYVELGAPDSDVSRQVVRAHERGRDAFEGQEDHHIECQRFHLLRLEPSAGEGGAGL